jgi:hypothetical protein
MQVVQSSIVLNQIQLSLNYPQSSTRWHLQIFFTHQLLSFMHHPLVKLISFSSNLIKKFLVTIENLPVAPSCMLSIKTFNANNHNHTLVCYPAKHNTCQCRIHTLNTLITIKYIISYVVVLLKESDNKKTVCNLTRQVGTPTQHGNHIYKQVGCGHDGYLLHPSPHLLLTVDLMSEEPNA